VGLLSPERCQARIERPFATAGDQTSRLQMEVTHPVLQVFDEVDNALVDPVRPHTRQDCERAAAALEEGGGQRADGAHTAAA
jgi:hypothetical protein